MLKTGFRFKRFGCVIFLCGLLGGGIYCSFPPLGADTYTLATENTMPATEKVQGLFLYDEQIVSAPAAGTWCSGCVSGDSVAAGEMVGELKKLNDINTEPVETVFSPVSGIYTDTFDGWETLLQNGVPATLSLSEVFEQKQGKAIKRINDFVQQGDPCFKVISEKGSVDLLLALGDIKLSCDAVSLFLDGKIYRGSVKRTITQNGQQYALVTLPNESVFLQSRFVEPEIIFGEKKGVIISNSAVFSRFGKTGVYCTEKGKIQYREIDVITRDEHNSLVNGVESGECLICRRK